MKITGLESLSLSVLDLDGCQQYPLDYGLNLLEKSEDWVGYEVLDSGSILFKSDPSMLEASSPALNIHTTVYGEENRLKLKVISTTLTKNCEIILNDGPAIHNYYSFNNLIPPLISQRNIKARTIIGSDITLNNGVHKADSTGLAEKRSLEFIQYAETINIKVIDKNNKPPFGITEPKFIPI